MSGERWAFGAGTAGQVPQDTTPNIADYEANCPEFVTLGGTGRLRRLPAAGRPVCTSLATCTTCSRAT